MKNFPRLDRFVKLPEKNAGQFSYQESLICLDRIFPQESWNVIHKSLASEGAYMPTLRQFLDFVTLLKSGIVYDKDNQRIPESEIQKTLEEIFGKRTPYRGEFLDAKFLLKQKTMYLQFNHHRKEDVIEIPINDILNNDAKVSLEDWLKDQNNSGLPLKNISQSIKDLLYQAPLDQKILVFSTSPGTYMLSANVNPISTNFSVRPVLTNYQANIPMI